jgi:hypothetical protein
MNVQQVLPRCTRILEFLTNRFPHLRYSGFSLIRSDLAVATARRG